MAPSGDAIEYRPMVVSLVGSVPIAHQGDRDEVLARLLELNAERARGEARSGTAAAKNSGWKAPAKRALKESSTEDLFS